ncbi:hypothetical protein GCM10016234_40570 [Tianweitania populi]|uniref:DUF2188 domain-containing protein n=1 Tax=Tianweitania populi TaxID=1607949 RepID=A0A8J3DY18_9HYPH|nr:hypothetical protein GCM10016234_40570 [Tianweitania populi]
MSVIHRCDDDQRSTCTFIICCTKENQWLVFTPDRSTGGFFRSAEEARRFARSEARSHSHGEVIVMSDDGCDVETFEQARKANVFHLDAGRNPAPGHAS